jgi:flagellar biosynthesis/type III secretory pathway protein FliH
MIEFTVPLSLPLRGVVLTERQNSMPEWLQQQFARLPDVVAARQATVAREARAAQAQEELAELKRERAAWVRGLEDLKRAVARYDTQCAAVVGELREVAVELAHAIASKLVFQQLQAGSFPVDRLVTEVLSRLNTRDATTVRLHPDDLAALQADEQLDQILDENVRLIADPKLSRGDCKAVVGEITVVYELQRQIEEIRRELLSTVNGHAEPGP